MATRGSASRRGGSEQMSATRSHEQRAPQEADNPGAYYKMAFDQGDRLSAQSIGTLLSEGKIEPASQTRFPKSGSELSFLQVPSYPLSRPSRRQRGCRWTSTSRVAAVDSFCCINFTHELEICSGKRRLPTRRSPRPSSVQLSLFEEIAHGPSPGRFSFLPFSNYFRRNR